MTPESLNPQPGPTSARRRIFLFSHARTASNLLMTLFAKHPQLTETDYNFHNAFMFGPERLMRRTTNNNVIPEARQKACVGATYQKSFDGLLKLMSEIEEQGKIPFVKEHVYFIMDPKVVSQHIPPGVSRKVEPTPMIVDPTASTFPNSANGADTPDPAFPTSSVPRTNPTVLPDSFLKTMFPMLVIRHPAKMIPSFYNASEGAGIGMKIDDEDFAINATFRWSRLVFDWYNDHVYARKKRNVLASGEQANGNVDGTTGNSPWPIVIDADELINDPRVLSSLCEITGLDPQYVQHSWEAVPEEKKADQGPMVSSFLSTIQSSTGIIKQEGPGREIIIADEAKKWAERWGADVAAVMERYVELAMVDYNYLMEYRL